MYNTYIVVISTWLSNSFFIWPCLIDSMHQLTYSLLSKVLFCVVYCLYSQYRVLSTACTELLSPGAPPLHSLNKAQLRKIFLSFPDSRVKIVVYLRPKENIKQDLTRSSGKYKYLLWLRFVVSAARASARTKQFHSEEMRNLISRLAAL